MSQRCPPHHGAHLSCSPSTKPGQVHILAKLAAGELKVEEASKLLAGLEPRRGSLSCRVSEKGAISVFTDCSGCR